MLNAYPPWLLLVRSYPWTIDLVIGRIRISNCNDTLCAAIVSFRSLIPRFVPAISRGTADRTTPDDSAAMSA